MIDADERIAKVKSGSCKLRSYAKLPAAWETRQLEQFGDTLALTCNPASPTTGFKKVMEVCPAGFRMHFPCIEGDPDVVMACGKIPFHRICAGHDILRRMFECTTARPHKEGTNKQLYALEWSKDHPGESKPWNVIDWKMGTNVGVWGGICTW